MSIDRIIWDFPDSYRDGIATAGDYMLIVKGGRPHEFAWAVSYRGDVFVDSGNDPCRTTQEARRITEAMYKVHSVCADHRSKKWRMLRSGIY